MLRVHNLLKHVGKNTPANATPIHRAYIRTLRAGRTRTTNAGQSAELVKRLRPSDQAIGGAGNSSR